MNSEPTNDRPSVENANSVLYTCQGTCSKAIEVEAEGDTIKRVQFYGGCNGNTKGIQQLVKGMKIDDVIGRLEGTTCGTRPTSCPDQLCHALRQLKAQQAILKS
ncbi:MAG: TIGR03905 family TSCPD domain-containing protein [Bacteroidaceae bacterium]|nr:TIGR03905 family TSCPD domain-containing protein [Bacteroidaceae bacterium]